MMLRRQLVAFRAAAAAHAKVNALPSTLTPSAAVASSESSSWISPFLQVARNYATGQQVKEADVQVPIPMFGVTGNYAAALYLSSVKANMLDKVESELKSLIEAAQYSPNFQNFMKDLSVPRDVRVKAMQEILGEAGFSDITKNFVALAAEHGRLRLLESIGNKFMSLTMAHRGEVNALVRTVIPLPPLEEKELKEALAGILGAGQTVKLEQKIDPSILGGLVIEFGDKLLDISIRTRVKQMEAILNESVDLEGI